MKSVQRGVMLLLTVWQSCRGLEQLRKSLPELAEMPETAEYDVIFVGSPVWWFTLTPAVKVLSAKQNGKGSGYILSLQAAGSREKTANDFKRLLEDKGAGRRFFISAV